MIPKIPAIFMQLSGGQNVNQVLVAQNDPVRIHIFYGLLKNKIHQPHQR